MHPLAVIALMTIAAMAAILLVRRNRTTVLEYQRGLLYRQGRFLRVLEPGRYWALSSDRVVLVDIRRKLLAVQGQEILT